VPYDNENAIGLIADKLEDKMGEKSLTQFQVINFSISVDQSSNIFSTKIKSRFHSLVDSKKLLCFTEHISFVYAVEMEMFL